MKRILGVVLLLVFASADAALMSRLSGQAYDDDAVDMARLTDPDYAQTLGWDADGAMYRSQAQASSADSTGVDQLDSTSWRLPDPTPIYGVAFDFSVENDRSAEFGHDSTLGYGISVADLNFPLSTAIDLPHLLYNILGSIGVFDSDGRLSPYFAFGIFYTDSFQNLVLAGTLFMSQIERDATQALYLSNSTGGRNGLLKTSTGEADRVFANSAISGAALRVPTAVWVFGSVLVVLAWIRRNAD